METTSYLEHVASPKKVDQWLTIRAHCDREPKYTAREHLEDCPRANTPAATLWNRNGRIMGVAMRGVLCAFGYPHGDEGCSLFWNIPCSLQADQTVTRLMNRVMQINWKETSCEGKRQTHMDLADEREWGRKMVNLSAQEPTFHPPEYALDQSASPPPAVKPPAARQTAYPQHVYTGEEYKERALCRKCKERGHIAVSKRSPTRSL